MVKLTSKIVNILKWVKAGVTTQGKTLATFALYLKRTSHNCGSL